MTTATARGFTSEEIRAWLGLPAGGGTREYRGAASDSRHVRGGELFVAIPGERVHGADFLEQAADAGARGAIVETGRERHDLPLEYFPVEDPVAALGTVAKGARKRTSARVIAITGSSGKTTVKEMVALAVGDARNVYRTAGNLNSQVGLPLTILGAPDGAEVWVLEIGASEPGEIARLAAIASPDDAIVTTVGPAHLEAFGTEARVLEEKLDLARGAAPTGYVVVGELPDALPRAARAIRADTIVAGLGPECDVRPERATVGGERISFERAGVSFELGVGGVHHLRDALIAVAIAEAIGVPSTAIAGGLARYAPVGHRGAVVSIGRLTVLADCYNANPESFRAALAQCRDRYAGRRLAAFAGSMLELGDHEAEAHRAVAREIVDAGFAVVAATGAFAEGAVAATDEEVEVIAAVDPEDARSPFLSSLRGDEVVLVKGSRGARLERVLDWLEEAFGTADGHDPEDAA
ncbi:MAG: UDP-N-acetylmuramoyl-tripeptide--D-alanyl-D-alanine ligase [Gemmatimonadota bacterium]|nr:UDP-N-acetylmuramoyl-tripeptide--D-alanyl-D-alanine ligase [Gemmatimonadota bacterium]